jgi:outer membrane receptor protein involved in Fe transport
VNLTPLTPLLPPALRPLVPPPFFLQVKGFGNPHLKEESLNAWELAYTGTIKGRTTVGIALYRNVQDDNINFVNLRDLGGQAAIDNGLSFYSPTNPARGVTVNPPAPIVVSPFIMGALAQVPPQFGGPINLPEKVFTYLNLGPIKQEGIELSVEHSFNPRLSAYANWSYQKTPEVQEADADQIPYPTSEVGVPAKNRVNLGLTWNSKRWMGSATMNYSDKAFWNDVLDAPYFGYTDSYAMVNATVGMKWADGKVETILKGTNLFNEQIQQHVFGDVLKMSVMAEVRLYVK